MGLFETLIDIGTIILDGVSKSQDANYEKFQCKANDAGQKF